MLYKKFLKLAASIVLCLLAGAIGSIFTSSSVGNWYRTLNKPIFNPPDWIFAPVWTLLYIMMGISLFMVWTAEMEKSLKRMAFLIFAIQLILNILWSVLFFGLQNPVLSLIEIFVLWIAILIAILVFKKISILSAFLLMPYLAWVTFAAFLNYSIVTLN
ncbi:MAG TPA: tryptophan-rich sensory protein [bacterium]|nr:tryptophan-rich sensory protein [bacterium]HOL49664.1 tryptophan-rich sensory protein [bacterium]HPO52024.1 tryptophan-rich sensory protein [bacterium]